MSGIEGDIDAPRFGDMALGNFVKKMLGSSRIQHTRQGRDDELVVLIAGAEEAAQPPSASAGHTRSATTSALIEPEPPRRGSVRSSSAVGGRSCG